MYRRSRASTFILVMSFAFLTGCKDMATSGAQAPSALGDSGENAGQSSVGPSSMLDLALMESLKDGTPLSYLEIKTLTQLPSDVNIGYALCLEAGESVQNCRVALGGAHIEFGLCVVGGALVRDCDDVLTVTSGKLGYALCLIGKRSVNDCNDALNVGGSQLGFGLCMNAGRDFNDCNDALSVIGEHAGFGLCMAAGRDVRDCNDAIDESATADSPNQNQLGFGLCMAANRDFRDCNDALASENIAFGVCMASGRSFNDCNDLL